MIYSTEYVLHSVFVKVLESLKDSRLPRSRRRRPDLGTIPRVVMTLVDFRLAANERQSANEGPYD
jgi:hypothetical protein